MLPEALVRPVGEVVPEANKKIDSEKETSTKKKKKNVVQKK